MKRQADLTISAELVLDIIKNFACKNPTVWARVVEHAIPDDATPVSCSTYTNGHDVVIRMESESFELVGPGDDVPTLPSPMIKKWNI